jgi:acetylglutamate kinase
MPMTQKDTQDKIAAHDERIRRAHMLSEALPYLRRYSGATFVIKYGGHAMGDSALAQTFARDVVLLKQVGINPIVVHGGGPQIGQMLERLKIQSSFIDGLRVTDQATVEIVEMVLAGSINKQVVTEINSAGGKAVGISGKDAQLIEARKVERTQRDPDSHIEKVVDLGFVGEPTKINADVLHDLSRCQLIPVIAPLGVGADGQTFNINADTVAGAIAATLKADKLILLTDIAGLMDKAGNLVSEASPADVRGYLADGTAAGGMIPKLSCCLDALQAGVKAAQILDGRIPHVLLLEIFSDDEGVGTKIHEV